MVLEGYQELVPPVQELTVVLQFWNPGMTYVHLADIFVYF
jgi:hypothetical protein